MNIVFMGSPEFSVPALQALLDSSHTVVAVYSQPPRPAGRGKKVQKTPVHTLAEKHDITVFNPLKFKEEDIKKLASLKPDIICVAAYGLLLPKDVLNVATCLNIHPSALPRWRGAAPMHRTVLAGDTTTDMCIMHMEEGLDTGPVYLRKQYDVTLNETTGELHDRMANEGATALLEVINNWHECYENQGVPQVGETTYAHKFKPEDLKEIRKVDFNKTALNVHNQIRGLSPWPGAVLTHKGEDIKVIVSFLEGTGAERERNETERNGTAGEILEISTDKISVQCAEGIVHLKKLQRSGKKAMDVKSFLQGYEMKVGDILS